MTGVRYWNNTNSVAVGRVLCRHIVGSGSLSSPMQEHRNFALFYYISITNFSTISECILLEFIWIKRMFSFHFYGCFYVCIACASKNRQLIFYGRYFPFVQCRSRGPRHERKQSMCLSARWQSHTRCTHCGITGSEIECRFQWCKRRGLLQTSLNFKPQNALKRLKHLPSKWSWIRTLSNEVWG